jgi:hypothetical protein
MKEKLDEIKIKYLSKEISYEEAKRQSKPLIDEFNEKAKQIAKKYNKRPKLIGFAGIFR